MVKHLQLARHHGHRADPVGDGIVDRLLDHFRHDGLGQDAEGSGYAVFDILRVGGHEDNRQAVFESEFASEQGGVLNLVFAAPEGQRLDTPERRAAIEGAIADLGTREFAPTADRAGIVSVGDPFSDVRAMWSAMKLLMKK